MLSPNSHCCKWSLKGSQGGISHSHLLHTALAKLYAALCCISWEMDAIRLYHLWFFSVSYSISPGAPRAQAWTCFWHGLMLMWIFRAPRLHSCFSFPHVTPLWSTTQIFLFPTFTFNGKSHHLEQRVESSEQKAICLLHIASPSHPSSLTGAPPRRDASSSSNYTEINSLQYSWPEGHVRQHW